jgi:hypothetical protein
MDESGTSKFEPHLVVAAVIVHADRQLDRLELRLSELVEKHIEPQYRDGFVFHASSLFNPWPGEGEFPPGLRDDRERRLGILEELTSIPAELRLPVCVGYVEKHRFSQIYLAAGLKPQLLVAEMHASAMALCTVSVERFMRDQTRDEVAWLFAENNDHVRRIAEDTQTLMKSSNAAERLDISSKDILPLVKIKDGINFARKEESPSLQLADACAWTIRKWFGSKDEAKRFFVPLEPWIFSYAMTTFDATGRR